MTAPSDAAQIDIAGSKDEVRKRHDCDPHEPRLQVYTDGSGLNDRITASAVDCNSFQSIILGTAGDAQVYHGEVAGIEQAFSMPLEDTPNEIAHPAQPRTAVIYNRQKTAALDAVFDVVPTSRSGRLSRRPYE